MSANTDLAQPGTNGIPSTIFQPWLLSQRREMQEMKGTWASCLHQSPENDTFPSKTP